MGKEQEVSRANSLGVKRSVVLRSNGRSLLSPIHTISTDLFVLNITGEDPISLAQSSYIFDSGGTFIPQSS